MSPASTPIPTRADRFSFGLGGVGHPGADAGGGPTRPPLDVADAVSHLAGLGACGITFSDDDLFAFGATDAERRTQIGRLTQLLADTGMTVPMVSTDLCRAPVFKAGGVTSNDRTVRRFALRKVLHQLDLAAELGAGTFVLQSGREGFDSDVTTDLRAALERYREALNLLGDYVTDQGYDIRVALEPTPSGPRGDLVLPTVGHALAFIGTLDRPERVGVAPTVSHEQSAGLNATAAVAQALDHGKLFHLGLNGQRGSRAEQSLVFGHGDLHSAFSLVHLLEHGGPQGGPAYDGPRHFEVRTPRTEDLPGVWRAAAASMRSYLLLKVRAAAFRADAEVQEALAESRVPELGRPTLDAEEGWEQLLRDRSTWEDFASNQYFGGRGFAFVRLQQLALEHLLGAR